MVKVNIYINHYSDCEPHPWLPGSNLDLNMLALRSVASIREFADMSCRVVVVDCGSPPVAHVDMLTLLGMYDLKPEVIWVRKKWHPQPEGVNAAVEDFLNTDGEVLIFMTSDMKFGKYTLSCGVRNILANKPKTFAEPSLLPYFINVKRYRNQKFWRQVKEEGVGNRKPLEYYAKAHIDYVIDSWGEPAPVSESSAAQGPNRRIGGLFFADRQAIETVPYPLLPYNKDDESYHCHLAVDAGCHVHRMGRIWMPHIGGLYRGGVGSWGVSQQRKYAPDPRLAGYDKTRGLSQVLDLE